MPSLQLQQKYVLSDKIGTLISEWKLINIRHSVEWGPPTVADRLYIIMNDLRIAVECVKWSYARRIGTIWDFCCLVSYSRSINCLTTLWRVIWWISRAFDWQEKVSHWRLWVVRCLELILLANWPINAMACHKHSHANKQLHCGFRWISHSHMMKIHRRVSGGAGGEVVPCLELMLDATQFCGLSQAFTCQQTISPPI